MTSMKVRDDSEKKQKGVKRGMEREIEQLRKEKESGLTYVNLQ